MRTRTVALALAATAALTAAGPAGAVTHVFETSLTGAAEFPPNPSTGTGFGRFTFDDAVHTLLVEVEFADLIGTTTLAHVHAPTAVPLTGLAPVATELPLFTGFPTGVHAGTYSHTFDLTLASSFNPAFVAGPGGGTLLGAEAALITAAREGRAYLNIHSTQNPGGEIRGFLTAVPEPSSWALMIGGFGLAGVLLRRRRATCPA